jgi:hypothetical protein
VILGQLARPSAHRGSGIGKRRPQVFVGERSEPGECTQRGDPDRRGRVGQAGAGSPVITDVPSQRRQPPPLGDGDSDSGMFRGRLHVDVAGVIGRRRIR